MTTINAAVASAVGISISVARQHKKLSVGALAQMIGVTTNTIIMWENGTHCPSMARFVQVCRCLDIQPSRVFVIIERSLAPQKETEQ